MRDGHIQAVEFLSSINDQSRIEEARQLFETKGKQRYADGFEIWEGPRFVYRFPETAPV
jgi:hypothetical protein